MQRRRIFFGKDMIESASLTLFFVAIYTIYDAIKITKGARKRAELKQKLRGVL